MAYDTTEMICFCSSLRTTFFYLVGNCVLAGLNFNCLAKCYKSCLIGVTYVNDIVVPNVLKML